MHDDSNTSTTKVSPAELLARAIVDANERGVEWRTRTRSGAIDVIAVRDGKHVATLVSDFTHDGHASRSWVAEALAFGPNDIAGLLADIDRLRAQLAEVVHDKGLPCDRRGGS